MKKIISVLLSIALFTTSCFAKESIERSLNERDFTDILFEVNDYLIQIVPGFEEAQNEGMASFETPEEKYEYFKYVVQKVCFQETFFKDLKALDSHTFVFKHTDTNLPDIFYEYENIENPEISVLDLLIKRIQKGYTATNEIVENLSEKYTDFESINYDLAFILAFGARACISDEVVSKDGEPYFLFNYYTMKGEDLIFHSYIFELK